MSEEREGELNISQNIVVKSEERSDGELNKIRKWKCQRCDKSFTQNAGLYNHMKKKHGLAVYVKASIMCKEPGCTFKCSMRDKLQAHLVNIHNKPLAFSTLKFSSIREFEEWKEVFEKQEKCRFVKKSGTRIRTHTGEKHTYLYCSRSGTFISNSKGKRTRMKKGTCKISNYCTASIDCIEEQSGTVIAKLCSTHYGHEPSVEYLRLTKSDKSVIADKLAQGVPRDVVIDNVRASVGENLDRIHFLTMKDIRNIERSFGIKSDAKQKPNVQGFASVNEWVNDMDSLGDESPIMFYKQKNTPKVLSDDFKCLDISDFCLVLMTKGQQEIFRKFGQNGVFYLTWLNISNGYDLSLLTLMVADDLNEAFPVTYMICSRISKEIEILLFKIIQEKLGSFCARAIMTDDRKSLYDSWCSVMGFVPYHLLSNRFVDADWRDRLITVQNEDVQCAVYEVLYSYLSCTDSTKFEENLNAFIKHLKENDDTLVFGLYFEDNYLHRVRLWAGCYDKKCVGVNEHLNLDIVYNELLTVCNNKGKFSKLLDKTLQGLLTIVRDRQHNRVQKITKQAQELGHHHAISMNINLEGIQAIENRKWQIKSESANLMFTVTRKTYECSIKCPLICSDCKMCAHMFECTCKVYNFDRTMCKHIHAIGRLFQKSLKVLEGIDLGCSSERSENDDENLEYDTIKSVIQEKPKVLEWKEKEEMEVQNVNSDSVQEEQNPKEDNIKCKVEDNVDSKNETVEDKQKKKLKGHTLGNKIRNLLQSIENGISGISDPIILKKVFIKLKKVKNVLECDSAISKSVKRGRGRPRKVKTEENSVLLSAKRKVGRPRKVKIEEEIPKVNRPRKLQEILHDDFLEEISQREDSSDEGDENDTRNEDCRKENVVAQEQTYIPKKRGRKPKMRIEARTDEKEEDAKKIKIEVAEVTEYLHRRRSKRNIKVRNFDLGDCCGKRTDLVLPKGKGEVVCSETDKSPVNSQENITKIKQNGSTENNQVEKDNGTSVIKVVKNSCTTSESVQMETESVSNNDISIKNNDSISSEKEPTKLSDTMVNMNEKTQESKADC
ncbi:uncharacterized protein LOC142319161 [Lycorma delicatula]|uniref:uncharacterized protein LOC142319161 n=1 Tax=Lycorma delicatula TaxID=130591 RepID=UPI003F517B4F